MRATDCHSDSSPLPLAIREAASTGLVPAGSAVLLAVSGGADSLALMYASADAAEELGWRLSVGHVHHGLRGREADRDLDFVADHARRLGLPFRTRRRDAKAEARASKLSPEAGARRARYEALAEMAGEAGAGRIATAHQSGDVLESYLLALGRRGGVASLAGPRRRRADGVVRPFLGVSRIEIEEYLAARKISFRRDATNGDLRLARNAVRRKIAAASPEERQAWAAEAERWRSLRDRLDLEFEARVLPALRHGPGTVLADAGALRSLEPDLLRRAVEEAAEPFSRPGRPPMTGRERETLVRLISGEGDFRFEAGRRIAVRRRGRTVSFSFRETAGPAPV